MSIPMRLQGWLLKSGNGLSLRVWLTLGAVGLVALPLIGISLTLLATYETSMRTAMTDRLQNLADKKADQIDSYLNERFKDAQTRSQDPDLIGVLTRLAASWKGNGVASEAYRGDAEALRGIFSAHVQGEDYYDTLLLDDQGNVLISLRGESDEATSLMTGPWRDSNLAHGFRLTRDYLYTQLTPFQPYVPSQGKPAAFLLAPVVKSGQFVGAIALQINQEQLQQVVADRSGLGVTGETVLASRVGDAVLYTGPLRHIANASFRHKVSSTDVAAPMGQALRGIM